MDRINGAGHVARMFVTEDIATNRPPTEITDAWLNGVQEEILAVISAAGIVPNQANLAQLLAALRESGVFQTQGIGENTTKVATAAFVQNNSIGCKGYAWQNMAGSRAISTTYTNTSGRPIWVSAGGSSAGIADFYALNVNSRAVSLQNTAANQTFIVAGLVPHGATYSLTKGGSATFSNLIWEELR